MKCLALKALATNINGKIYMGWKPCAPGRAGLGLWDMFAVSGLRVAWGPSCKPDKEDLVSFVVLRVNQLSCLESGKMKT